MKIFYTIALLLLLPVAPLVVQGSRGLPECYGSFYTDDDNSCDEQQEPLEDDSDIVSCDPGSAMTDEPPQDASSFSSSNSCKNSGQRLGPNAAAAAIAQNAAEVAKAANEAQAGAAEDAAKLVKTQLAEKAMQAARVVNAVLEGKEAIFESFQRQLREAEDAVRQVSASLVISGANAQSASAASTCADAQKGRIKIIIRDAMARLVDIDALDKQVIADLREKFEMVAKAKERAKRLERELVSAIEECEKMTLAVKQAATAAAEARQKTAEARQKVAEARQKLEAAASTPKGQQEARAYIKGILALYDQRRHQREAKMLQQKQHI
ncbi:uncharacterized abhydrolase domain-containing protein DDB_G0269086 [Drosophila miranda]|uniref:uncharacterized abhydrolase domain-containing protein DDB_G0269086 n=1 Tax=Drosophila miranda TaxID=7229 RepID=UPI0007E7C71C|nr:uncharacterized abhydrolase domain-containing protein DDB_G0269086 [Drosophila miranda]